MTIRQKLAQNVATKLCALALIGATLPAVALFAGEANAQNFVNQEQILRQLRTKPGSLQRSQIVVEEEGQSQGQTEIKKKKVKLVNQEQLHLQQEGNVVFRRTPQANGQIVNGDVINGSLGNGQQGGGQVVLKRVPMPEEKFEVVGQGGKVKTFRAPQPQDEQFETVTQEMRVAPPVVRKRVPLPQNNDLNVANNNSFQDADDPVARGLDVRVAKKIVQPVETFETGTNYPGYGRIDLEILFEYDSDRINPSSVKQLIALGDALNDPSLGNGRFVIAGHTDAAGSRYYNNDLSIRRARAVYEFLINYGGINPRRLLTEGYGEDLLKFPDAPESGQNRRVEVINVGDAG